VERQEICFRVLRELVKRTWEYDAHCAFLVGDSLVHCKMFSNDPDLNPSDVSRAPLPSCSRPTVVTTENVSRHC
jgi:hypothetical protein